MAEATCFLIGFQWTADGCLVTNEGFDDVEGPLLLESAQALFDTLHPEFLQIEKPTSSKSDETPLEFKHLERAPDLYRLADGVLQDIKKMNVEGQRGEKLGDVPRHARQHLLKVRALEKQQEALLSSKQQQQEMMNGDEEMMSLDNSVVEDEASLRLVRTLNSIRILFPLLIAMINHPRRNDEKLVIHSTSLVVKNGKKKPRCWLLGEHVFDICTPHQTTRLRRDVKEILQSCCPKQDTTLVGRALEATSFRWETFLPTCFEQQQYTAIRHPVDLLLVNQNPNSRNKITQDTVLSAAQSCDKWFVAPIQQNRNPNSTNNKRYQQSIRNLRDKLSSAIRRKYPNARLSLYGSCLSDLSLGKSSDVDISLYLPSALADKREFEAGTMPAREYERRLKNYVYRITDLIRKNHSFADIEPITRARIPLVKGKCGDLCFDICFLNDIAVVNSSLLKEYSLVDERVKLLMLIVKEWARDNKINSAANNTLSSYAWMNLVIFYVQCLGLVPNLQSPELMVHCGFVPDRNDPFHVVNDLNTAFLRWEQVRNSGQWVPPNELTNLPVSVLLYGFFDFYAHSFPQNIYAVSIRVGRCGLLKTAFENSKVSKLCIEDPFETFQSHYPHCLGTPCGDNSQVLIRRLLVSTEEKLRKVLQQTVVKRDFAASNWPTHSISRSSSNKGSQNPQGKPVDGQQTGKHQRGPSKNNPRGGRNKQQKKRNGKATENRNQKRNPTDDRPGDTKKAPPRDGGNKKQATANKTHAKGSNKKAPPVQDIK